MKVTRTILGSLLLIALVVAAVLLLAAGPTMLVMGALHGASGTEAVPALGFWQTLGALFITASFGGAFHSGSVLRRSKTDK